MRVSVETYGNPTIWLSIRAKKKRGAVASLSILLLGVDPDAASTPLGAFPSTGRARSGPIYPPKLSWAD